MALRRVAPGTAYLTPEQLASLCYGLNGITRCGVTHGYDRRRYK